MAATPPSIPIPLMFAVVLSLHGWKKKSLSPGGATTAFFVGYLMLSGGVKAFGVGLIGFYLLASRATKYGKNRKSQMEDGYHEAGYRTGWQVLSNSIAALSATFIWNTLFVPWSVHAWLASYVGLNISDLLNVKRANVYNASQSGWCPLDPSVSSGWSRCLVFAALGHFACCLGDTLASELGILSRSQPRLITTFKHVPPGTNGAMSLGGTVASVVGGAIVGALMGLSFVLENSICSGQWGGILVETVGWGMFGGGFGSLIDSLMGATIQRTRYSVSKKVILQDDSGDIGEVKVISGLNILTNNQVNLVSSAICAVVIGWAASVI